jgi:transcriptional regulator with XRE-family HTH domain
MPKPITRTYSQYNKDAVQLLGQLIRENRLARTITATDLATRAGISRALLQRIERGDPSCSIGAVFEAAAICGVLLFDLGERSLVTTLEGHKEKLALLPRSTRTGKKKVNDDF